MDGFHFLLYAPIIGPVLGLIVGLIASAVSESNSSSSTTKSGTKSVSSSRSSSYHSYGSPSSHYDYHIPDYRYNSYSSLESEMRAHNARMEQMLQEQNRIMIDNELHRINESIRRPLSEQFDTRITNIFRNPWEGIL